MSMKLDDIPNLVIIASGARPHLNRIAVCQFAIRQIQALALAGPLNTIIGRGRERLIRIATRARPDLHLDTVGCGSARDVQTLVGKDLVVATGLDPLLVCG